MILDVTMCRMCQYVECQSCVMLDGYKMWGKCKELENYWQ